MDDKHNVIMDGQVVAQCASGEEVRVDITELDKEFNYTNEFFLDDKYTRFHMHHLNSKTTLVFEMPSYDVTVLHRKTVSNWY